MPSISSAYRGPLVIIGLGGGFSVVGAVPLAITFSIGVKTSATIIGMGFVGFGFLLIIPGLFWCLLVKTHSFKWWRRRGKKNKRGKEESAPTLESKQVKVEAPLNRPRQWPPAGMKSPPLIISDQSAEDLNQRLEPSCPGEGGDPVKAHFSTEDLSMDACHNNTVMTSVVTDSYHNSQQTIASSVEGASNTEAQPNITHDLVNTSCTDYNNVNTDLKAFTVNEMADLQVSYGNPSNTEFITNTVRSFDDVVIKSDVTLLSSENRTVDTRAGIPAVLIYEESLHT